MENKSYESDDDLAEFLTTIDWIELRSGLNFLPDFDAAAQKRLEATKATKPWNVPKPSSPE